MTHVIITGGSSGIGLAVARIYAARGYDLSIVARTQAALDAACRELATIPGVARIGIESVDVSDEGSMLAAIARCERDRGPCDILITCAGMVAPGLFLDQGQAEFERQMTTNFFGSAGAVRAVYPGMAARRHGKVMLVSSGAGLIGIPGYSAYCASKFALHGFAAALRSEARAHGISISVCFPPDTETPQLARELNERPPEAAVIMGRVKAWPAATVARRIVRAVDRREFEVFFGPALHLLGRFGSLVGPALNWWFDRAVDRARRKPPL